MSTGDAPEASSPEGENSHSSTISKEERKKQRKKDRAEAEAAKAMQALQNRGSIAALLAAAKAERIASGELKVPEPPPNYRVGFARDEVPEEVVGDSGKLYNSTSIFCLQPGDQPRRLAIYIVESKPFDPIILFTILCNCVTMAWESPLDPCCTQKAAFIDVRLACTRTRALPWMWPPRRPPQCSPLGWESGRGVARFRATSFHGRDPNQPHAPCRLTLPPPLRPCRCCRSASGCTSTYSLSSW